MSSKVMHTYNDHLITRQNRAEKEFLAAVDTLSEKAFDDQCTTANPRYPLITEIKQMYLDAYYGK